MIITITKDDLRRAKSVNYRYRDGTNDLIAQSIKNSVFLVCSSDKRERVSTSSNSIIVGEKEYKVTKRLLKIMDDFDNGTFDESCLPINVSLLPK